MVQARNEFASDSERKDYAYRLGVKILEILGQEPRETIEDCRDAIHNY